MGSHPLIFAGVGLLTVVVIMFIFNNRDGKK